MSEQVKRQVYLLTEIQKKADRAIKVLAGKSVNDVPVVVLDALVIAKSYSGLVKYSITGKEQP